MREKKWKEMFASFQKREGNTFIQFLLDAGLDVNALNKYGETMLSSAAECGNLDTIKFLVQKGADGNVSNSDGSKSLHIAAEYGHKDIVKFFLNMGICVDSCDNEKCTPLHYAAAAAAAGEEEENIPLAARESYQELVHILVDSNADLNAVNRNGDTPLLLAACYSRKYIVELLIQLGANVERCGADQWTVLHHSCRKGWAGIVRTLVEGRFDIDLNARNSQGHAPLMVAAESSYKDVVELLIDFGADVECQDFMKRSLLHHACEKGWLDVVKYLVNKGCDLNAQDTNGCTPLLCAADLPHACVIEYLIESGADVNCCDVDGWAALHKACCENSLDVVKCLIKNGSDRNAQTNNHDTPLHLSVWARNLEIIEHLLKMGVDCTVENARGDTAFSNFIHGRRCVEVIILFLENGAYFRLEDYVAISEQPFLKEGILQDMKLCTQAVMNKFNNAELPEIYKIPVLSKHLPSIEKLKIVNGTNVSKDIAVSVMSEIQTKGYCNVLNVCPIVLKRLCVGSLVEYYGG